MTVQPALALEYAACMRDYLDQPDERSRARAYELGRRALDEGAGVIDVIATHDAAMSEVQPDGRDAAAASATGFLLECLAPFEMAFRGFREANELLQRLNVELEQRIAERTHALSDANAELEAFTYSVSHDLRAPLRTIDGFSRVVGQHAGPQLDEAGLDALERVHAGVARMTALIDDLLKLSRLTRQEMRIGEVDLSALAEEIVQDLREQQPAFEVDVRIEPGLTATADPHLIRIALTNLLANAFKFTRTEAHPLVQFGCEREDGQRRFFVRDNGVGFDMANSERLFKPFERLHTDGDFPGSGIGLAIVKRIVRRHGGRIGARAAVGEGAIFWFTLGPAGV